MSLFLVFSCFNHFCFHSFVFFFPLCHCYDGGSGGHSHSASVLVHWTAVHQLVIASATGHRYQRFTIVLFCSVFIALICHIDINVNKFALSFSVRHCLRAGGVSSYSPTGISLASFSLFCFCLSFSCPLSLPFNQICQFNTPNITALRLFFECVLDLCTVRAAE